MFVVRATHKDETRRLSFEGSKFPSYGQVQIKVCMHHCFDAEALTKGEV